MEQAIAQAQAQRLRQKARKHKRAAAAERRAAREAMQELAALMHQCSQLGIILVLEEDQSKSITQPRRQSVRRSRTDDI